MGFGSVMHFCLQIIIPFIIFIISIAYVSDEQSDWFNQLQTNFDANIIKGNKGIFFGTIAFILAGIVSVLTITHKQNLMWYANNVQETSMFRPVDTFIDSLKSNLEFILFPITILFSSLGLVVAYQVRTMLPHVVLSFIAMAMTLYLIFSFGTRISITAAVLLVPLLVWQIANIVLYWNVDSDAAGPRTDPDDGTSGEPTGNGGTSGEPTGNGGTSGEPTGNGGTSGEPTGNGGTSGEPTGNGSG